MSAELEARRTAAGAVLADFRRELQSAPLSRPPGREWLFRLERVLADVLAALGQGHPGQPGSVAEPFETEAQVRELPEVQAIYAAFDRDPGVGKMAPHNHRLLDEALTAAGVELGAYDRRILSWLAGWEPQTVAVVVGWVARAHRPELEEARVALLSAYEAPVVTLTADEAATALDALEVAAEYRRYRASLTCEACATSPVEVCPDHEADLDRADAYDTLTRQITEATRYG